MNKIRTQFLALLTLMLMGMGAANAATDYGIYVGETKVTSDNASNITGNGQFSYNASTKTLTVSNANLNNQGSMGSGIRNDAVDGLTIRLVGTSTLTTRMNAISSYKNFSITGTGTLNVTAGSRGIITYSQSAVTCTINGPTLNITASNYAFEDYYGTTTLSVKGADTRVTLKTGSTINAVNNLKSFSLGDGLKIVHPSGASFNSSQKTVVANDTACKGTVAIGITYGLYIGETMVNSYNYDDVNGDGMFAYRPNSKTLDVRSGTFTNTGSLGSGISNREIDGLTIHITGTTVNINARNSAVYSEKSFKITGPGTLNATSTTSYALGFGGTDSKTCTITTDANGSSPKINIKAASYAVSDYRGNTTLALQGANTVLTLQPGSGYAAVNNLMDLTFADGLAIVSPTGGASPYFNSSLKTITVDGATGYKGKIEMAYDYGMYIGETRVSKLNYTDILGNGQFKYDPSSKTLTVNNATLTNEGSLGNGIDNREISGLTIYLTGTNTITTRNSPIATAKSINIKGSGTLNATAQYAPGISFWGTGNKTCVVSGPKLNIISTGYYALDDNSGNTTLQVEGSNTSISLEQKSSYATINNLKALSLASGYYITEPAGAEYSSSLKSITMDGSTPTTEKVVISNTQPDLGIWIDNTRVTPENLNDILGNGQLSYNLQTKTLTMTNFNYNKTSGNGSVISSKVKDLTIRVVGTNSITSNNYVLGSQGSLTFTGTGSLTLRCNTDAGVSGIALWSEDNGSSADVINCTFDGPKVTIISPNGTAFSGNTEDENTIIVKGSTTRLDMQPSSNPDNNGCMFLINDFQMGSGISIIEPEGAYFDSKFGDFTLDGTSEYKGRVVVSADIDYGISIGETIVKASNASDVLGNGQFSYDYETNTLTVKNADLDNTVVGPSEMPANQGTGIVNWNNEGLTVVLEGNNVIKCRGGAISANVSTNITGHGKLTCETTESWAFNLQGAGTVCTIDGPTLDITGATYALADENYHTSKLVVKGTSNITLWSGTNYQTIKGIGDLELGSDIYINQPEGGYFSKQLGTVTTNGSFAYQGKINIGYYSINIGGTKITPENAKDVLGDGTVSYHADAKMLTLRNANIINTNSQVSYGQGIVAIGVDGLTIKVEGNNTLTSKSWALSATKNFSITGTGSLTITATDNGAVALWSNDGDDINCTIDGPQLTLISATNGSSFSGSYGYQSTVIVKGSTTRVDMQPEQTQYGNECLYLIDDFKVSSDLYVTEPYGAYFDPNLKDFTLDGTKKYCGRVVVGPAVDYGFLVADEVVTTANAKDVLGNGQFSYDPATNVLTMKDANLTKTNGTLGTGIDIRSTQDLTINIEGTNYIKTRNEPIASIKSFRITGTGTLEAIAAASEGILFWSRDTMTCTVNGPKINIQGMASGLVDYYNNSTLRVEGSTTSLSFQPITTNLTDWSTQPINEYQDVNDFTIKGLKSLIMGSGVSIIEPQGGRFNASLQSITTDGTNAYKGKVTIGTNEDYGFYVAETRVKTSNADDILGDGCFSYDPASKTLYVRNAHLENQGSLGSGISNREVEGMTIVFEGDNYFSTRMNVIGMQKSTTIAGRGTLTATSTDGYGLSLTEKGSTCIISGPKLDFKVRTSPISCYRDSITLIVEGAQTEISMETTGGYKTIDNLSFLLLGDGLYLTEPADGWFSESVKSVTTDGTNAYKGKVVISNRAPSQGEQKCDLNGDGIINALDIQNVIMACVAMITDPKFDINGDGIVNALDIQNVINAAAAAARRMGLELE